MAASAIYLVLPVAIGIVAGFFLAYQYGDDAGIDTYAPAKGKQPVEDGAPPGLFAGQHQLVQGSPMLTESLLISGGSPALGSPNAPVTMVEWGDYQCTYCHLFHKGTLNHTISKYIDAGEVRLVFKDFALNGPDSVLAAEASHCAADQSEYWAYHDALYRNWGGENTGWVTRESLGAYADTVGLDPAEFEECMDSQKYKQKVLRLYESGQEIGIDATPSFVVFGDTYAIKIRGNQPSEVFVDAIESLLQASSSGGSAAEGAGAVQSDDGA